MSKELPNKCQCTSCSVNMVFNTRLQELVCEGCGTRHPVPEYLLISKERAEKTETQIAKESVSPLSSGSRNYPDNFSESSSEKFPRRQNKRKKKKESRMNNRVIADGKSTVLSVTDTGSSSEDILKNDNAAENNTAAGKNTGSTPDISKESLRENIGDSVFIKGEISSGAMALLKRDSVTCSGRSEKGGAASSPLSGDSESYVEPDLIIPFKKDLAVLRKYIQDNARKLYFINDDFLSSFGYARTENVYIPALICSGRIAGSTEFSKARTDKKGNIVGKYECRSEGGIELHEAPLVISGEDDEQRLKMVHPYDMSGAVPYSPLYFAGMEVVKHDINVRINDDLLRLKSEVTFDRYLKVNTGSVYHELHKRVCDIIPADIKYALLPLWTMEIDYYGDTRIFLMNGQTGKCYGDFPVDDYKIEKCTALVKKFTYATGIHLTCIWTLFLLSLNENTLLDYSPVLIPASFLIYMLIPYICASQLFIRSEIFINVYRYRKSKKSNKKSGRELPIILFCIFSAVLGITMYGLPVFTVCSIYLIFLVIFSVKSNKLREITKKHNKEVLRESIPMDDFPYTDREKSHISVKLI